MSNDFARAPVITFIYSRFAFRLIIEPATTRLISAMVKPFVTAQNGRYENAETTRMIGLDGIRGLACLTIVVYHYVGLVIDGRGLTGIPFAIAASVKLLTNSAWSGVDLFFVLSGFLIGGILIDNRNAANYYKVFYIRRFCRILPLYFLMIVVYYSLANAATLPIPDTARYLIFNDPISPLSYLTFTQNFAMVAHNALSVPLMHVTWSLAIEEQFYLLLPLLLKVVPPRRLPWVLVLFILAGPICRTIAFATWGSIASYALLPCRIDALMLGVLFAYLSRQPSVMQRLRLMRRLLYGLLFVLFIGSVLVTVTHGMYSDPIMLSFGYSWLLAFYGCLFLLVISGSRGIVKTLTTNRFTVYIGRLAYGIYLFHTLIFVFMHGIVLQAAATVTTLPGIVVTLGAFAVTVGLAQLLFTFLETPFINFGRKLHYDKPEAATLPSSAASMVNSPS